MPVQVQLSYRKQIDHSTEDPFEKNILRYSYQEFLLKSQVYNPDGLLRTFSQMKLKDGRANSLHYKSSFAIGGFMQLLQNKIPTLQDNAGKALSFETFRFELLESDITDEQHHHIAIHYISPMYNLHHSLNQFMILSPTNNSGENKHETFTLEMTSALSVIHYEEIHQAVSC
ncbi:MAG: hypothetical protein EOO88_46535 [Pedobacter sp.]|nr:MAG: hypothetical protein EOO88_46535 [Pedobacter sp.]